ncbi:MAG: AAA family ATPase, partial [Bacteroidaceae bacterium]|nr:AAA family ATPase [Bacteroidaceae bacterium]
NFKNTIIIMTSNLGSAYIQEQFSQIDEGNRERIIEETTAHIMELLKKNIRPEFLNRIDETIMFTPLDKEEIKAIVRLQTDAVGKMLRENGIELSLTERAIDFIASAGFDPEFGARPIKRAIQRHLLNDLSKQILAGTVHKDSIITVDSSGSSLEFRN